MAPEFVQALVDDSVALDYPWKAIVLHGGEPALHPRFAEICFILSDYRKTHRPELVLKCCTNGCGAALDENRKLAAALGFEISDSHKTGEPLVHYHTPYCSSPADCGEPFYLGCFQTSQCGICLTPRGFYECSPAGAAWRVMGYEPICTSLKDVTPERLAEGFKAHCKHCGYARYKDRNWTHNPGAPMTKTWIDALARYNSRN
jgi:hypothetical protein